MADTSVKPLGFLLCKNSHFIIGASDGYGTRVSLVFAND